MEKGKTKNTQLPGVGCKVCNCVYHTAENACVAGHISVQNENAQKKAETFCSTFAPKNDCAGTPFYG